MTSEIIPPGRGQLWTVRWVKTGYTWPTTRFYRDEDTALAARDAHRRNGHETKLYVTTTAWQEVAE